MAVLFSVQFLATLLLSQKGRYKPNTIVTSNTFHRELRTRAKRKQSATPLYQSCSCQRRHLLAKNATCTKKYTFIPKVLHWFERTQKGSNNATFVNFGGSILCKDRQNRKTIKDVHQGRETTQEMQCGADYGG